MPCRTCPVGASRRRCVLRSHLDRQRRHHAGVAADRVRRRCVPNVERSHRRADQRAAAPQRRPHLHGPIRGGPRPRRHRRGRGRRRHPVRPRHAGRTHGAGLGRTARHHQLRSGHQPPRPGHSYVPRSGDGPKSLTDKQTVRPRGRGSNVRWLAGAAGLTAVGSAAGVSVARSLRRHVSTDDPYEDEDFELLDADRSYVVTTPDGVDLAVREVGPEDARLTVVFAHGFCLQMGAFHFQRARLAEQWGPQVRMVFYDQRGHGQSGEAPPDSYTVTQLGTDMETVLAVMAPRGPVVLVGHSMGGMTVLSHARQFPKRYPTRIVGVAIIASAAEGVSRSPLGEILKNPALEAVRFAVRYAPKTVHRTRGAASSVIGPILRAASYGDED